MGLGHVAAIGTPPVCTSIQFKPWAERLIEYRLAECPVDRSTTYYVSNSGNDANPGTEAQPWQTITRVNTAIAALASNANVAIRFKRGDVWRDRVTLSSIGKSNITLGAYGSGKLPNLSWFVPIDQFSWAPTAGRTSVWEFVLGTRPSTIRLVGDLEIGFVQAASIADCEATNGSWFWDGSKLYVRPLQRQASHTVNDPVAGDDRYEYCVNNAVRGIDTSGDNVRIDNIRVDGAGCQYQSSNASKYGIYWTPVTPTDCCVVSNCESYYNEAHNIGTTTNGVGGIITIYRCRMGWMGGSSSVSPAPNGGSLSVSYAAGGSNEGIFAFNTYIAGNVHTKAVPYGFVMSSAGPTYMHTGGGAAKISLGISWYEESVEGMYPVSGAPAYGDAPTATTMADRRAFVVGYKARTRGFLPRDAVYTPAGEIVWSSLFPSGGLWESTYINCDLLGRVACDLGNGLLTRIPTTGPSAGMFINSSLTMDWTESQAKSAGVGRFITNNAGSKLHFYNCHIKYLARGNALNYLTTAAGVDGKLINSIFEVVGGTAASYTRAGIGWTASASRMFNNLWVADSGIPSVDETPVFAVDTAHRKSPNFLANGFYRTTDDLMSTNQQLIESSQLEYDMYWRPRLTNATARGPIEATVVNTTSLATGRIAYFLLPVNRVPVFTLYTRAGVQQPGTYIGSALPDRPTEYAVNFGAIAAGDYTVKIENPAGSAKIRVPTSGDLLVADEWWELDFLSLTSQQTRDAMKLAPSVGAAATNSVDHYLSTTKSETRKIGRAATELEGGEAYQFSKDGFVTGITEQVRKVP